jgi:hypothetical protein
MRHLAERVKLNMTVFFSFLSGQIEEATGSGGVHIRFTIPDDTQREEGKDV